jgi:hypothetical protein
MVPMEEGGAGEPSSGSQRGAPRGDRVEIVKVLVLALVSFVAGFALVLIFLRQPSDTSGDEAVSAAVDAPPPAAAAPVPATAPTARDAGPAAPAAGGYEPTGGYGSPTPAAAPAAGEGEATAVAAADEGDAPAEVPPGKTPDGMLLDGDAFYLKCWDDAGVERKGADCDRLPVFEKRFSTRLYVVDKCRIEGASASAAGKLSVASEVDFQAGKVSFWNAPSSDVPNAAQIGSCLRGALAGMPIQGIEHKYARYRVFFTVLFGKEAAKKAAEDEKAGTNGEAGGEKPGAKAGDKPPAGKGKLVEVMKDNVRVRKAPVDGEIIGKIGKGNQVRLLKQKEGWCQVATPAGNEGWMICDALGL